MAYEFNHYYELQNVATGKYVNVLGNHEDGTVKNGETVNLFNRTNNPDQRWALENYGGNGNVRIVLQRGEGWYALNYNTRNANCIVWHLNTADDIDTVITAVQVESLTDTYYLYGVSETNIGQYVHESDVAWTNGNWEANCRAVTIETSTI